MAHYDDILCVLYVGFQVNIGWSEPVLHYIKHHRNTIVQPAVENIDQWSIEYERKSTSNDMWRGVFLWDMR